MSLLQAQDALSLYSERPYAEVRAALHQRLPDMQPVGGRHVDLVAELAGEADAPHETIVHAGDTSGADPHVGEGVRREVNALGQAQEQLAGLRSCDVDAGVRRGYGGDVDVPPWVGGLQPVVDPLPRACSAGGGRRHDVTLWAETACNAVVEDHAVLEAHHDVA